MQRLLFHWIAACCLIAAWGGLASANQARQVAKERVRSLVTNRLQVMRPANRSARVRRAEARLLNRIVRRVQRELDLGRVPTLIVDIDWTLFGGTDRIDWAMNQTAQLHGISALDNYRFTSWADLRADRARILGAKTADNHQFALDFVEFLDAAGGTGALDNYDAGAVALLRTLSAMGAKIVYLTGRLEDHHRATYSVLERAGFPVERNTELRMRRRSGQTVREEKRVALHKLRKTENVVATFDDSVGNNELYRQLLKGATVVRVNHEGAGSIVDFYAWLHVAGAR